MALGLTGTLPLTWWSQMLRAHSALQVHGFVIILTLGVALLVLPKFLGVPLAAGRVALVVLVALISGLALRTTMTADLWARPLQAGGVIGFLYVLRRTRVGAPFPEVSYDEKRLNRLHAAFMASGVLWLLLAVLQGRPTETADLVLWGFAAMYVAGIGLRVHPQMLGIGVFSPAALGWSVLLWNLGLAGEVTGWSQAPWLLLSGIGLYLVGLGPFRGARLPATDPAWLRHYIKTAYLWLILALAARLSFLLLGSSGFAASGRHLMASGFLLTMMCGMGFRLIPLFENRPLVWKSAPHIVWAFLAVGNVCRTVGQSTSQLLLFGLGASIQACAALTFSLALLLTLSKHASIDPPKLPGWAIL